MNKDDFIQHLIKGMGSDCFGPGRLRKQDQVQWTRLCQAEANRLGGLGYSELEALYRSAEGLYEMPEGG